MPDQVTPTQNTIGTTAVPFHTHGGADGPLIPVAHISGNPVSSQPYVVLADATTVTLNASSGNIFYISAGGNRTLAIPTQPVLGKKIIIVHFANGGNRT